MQYVQVTMSLSRQVMIIYMVSPILQATAGLEAVLLTPLPRWPDGPGCQRPTHMVGYNKVEHMANLLTKMEAIRKSAKELIREQKKTTVWVINHAKEVIGSHGPWTDHTTPNIGAYQAILKRIQEEIATRSSMKTTEQIRLQNSGVASEAKRQRRDALSSSTTGASWRGHGSHCGGG